jgi:SAM-dependent methyltransferase
VAVGRSRSFGSVAEAYDRLRPEVPDVALDWLVPDGVATALDLAAGTGALTRGLCRRVATVLAVEPDARMAAVLARRCPTARLARGVGEALPLADGCVDAAYVSSAWHWLDPARAVPELARVLRPGGTLGVVWNGRPSGAWIAGIGELVPRPDLPGAAPPERRRVELGADAPFSTPETVALPWTRAMTADEVVALLGTYSGVITLPAEERAALMAQARRRLREATGAEGDDVLDVPFTARCWRAHRLPH